MTAAAIIVAAGSGSRMGGKIPKQLQLLHGRPVLEWSLAAFRQHPNILQVIVVTRPELIRQLETHPIYKDVTLVEGGATRAISVSAGLSAVLSEQTTSVLIHDAARPGLQQETITALLLALEPATGAAPALNVSDALKRQDGDKLETIDRENLSRVQTPQAFKLDDIRRALANAPVSVVDDLEAIERAGGTLKLIEGDHRLHKLTYPEDMTMLEKLLTPPGSPRIGKGFDVHAFEAGDHVTLCGCKIPHNAKLKGHSDADVGWHALTDAILGALAMGDIGDHFPPSDDRWKGADSAVFLREAGRMMDEAGYVLSNADLTLICEAPKIGPHREAMRERTAQLLGVEISAISVKATTTERLGFTGRGEGIAAEAVALLTPK